MTLGVSAGQVLYKSGPSFSISPLELVFIRFSFSDSQKMSSGVSF